MLGPGHPLLSPLVAQTDLWFGQGQLLFWLVSLWTKHKPKLRNCDPRATLLSQALPAQVGGAAWKNCCDVCERVNGFFPWSRGKKGFGCLKAEAGYKLLGRGRLHRFMWPWSKLLHLGCHLQAWAAGTPVALSEDWCFSFSPTSQAQSLNKMLSTCHTQNPVAQGSVISPAVSAGRGWVQGSKASSHKLLLAEDDSKLRQCCWSARSVTLRQGKGLWPWQKAAWAPCPAAEGSGRSAARGGVATGATVFVTNIPSDAGTRLVNDSNYLNLPSGAQRFNLSVALNQVSDIDQRILL